MQTVGDIMTPQPQTVGTQTSIGACLQTMTPMRLRQLPVVDDAGRLIGLAHEADLRRYSRRGITDQPVGHLAVPATTARAGDDAIRTLARQLSDNRRATVVVDDEERPVGMLTVDEALSLARVCLQPWTAVSDVCWPGPVPLIDAECSAREAIEQLKLETSDHLVVMRGEQLVGIVSLQELSGRDDAPVAKLVASFDRSVPPTMPIMDAIPRLTVVASGCVPVLREGRVVGLLRDMDVVRALTRQLILSSTVPSPSRR